MSRFKFDHLHVDGTKTASYTLYGTGVAGSPDIVLHVRSATEENGAYYSARLKAAQGLARNVRGAGLTKRSIEESRALERELYAEHVLAGWENVCDPGGREIKFGRKEALELLEELPAWMFEDLKDYCSRVQNFLPDAPDPGDVAETAKN